MKGYDSGPETAAHVVRVAEFLSLACDELAARAARHDSSKFGVEEKPYFDEMTPLLSGTTYGSEEYFRMLARLRPALDHHYAVNTHHPEHYDAGVDGMDLFDLMEMFFDWKASSERHDDGDIYRSIELNGRRFNMSEQLSNIMINTARNMGY